MVVALAGDRRKYFVSFKITRKTVLQLESNHIVQLEKTTTTTKTKNLCPSKIMISRKF